MKKIIILACVILTCAFCADAQVIDDIYGETQDQVKLDVITPATKAQESSAEREKRLKAYSDSVAYNRAVRALQNKHWVLLAERINVGYTSYTVHGINSNSNFMFQQGADGIVQVAYNQVDPGVNGLGGITLQGKISGERLEINKKGDATYSYHINSFEINAHVMITVVAGSNNAQAFIDSTFGPGRLVVYGTLVPYDRSRHR